MLSARILVSGLALLVLTACRTYGSAEDVPARIDDPTDAGRAELQRSVNSALGTAVLLANDALTDSSTLTIEQNQPGTMQNPQPQGRILDMPVQFRLVKRGNDCYLVDQRDGTRYLLEHTSCATE